VNDPKSTVIIFSVSLVEAKFLVMFFFTFARDTTADLAGEYIFTRQKGQK
jgi:hypothetical protein